MAPYVLGGAIDSFRDRSLHGPSSIVFAGLTIGIQAIDSGLRFVTRIYVSGSSRHMEYDLRNDVYAHMQSLDQKFFQDHQTGDLMARVSNDVTTVREFLGPGPDGSLPVGPALRRRPRHHAHDRCEAGAAGDAAAAVHHAALRLDRRHHREALPRGADAVRRPLDVRPGELLRRARRQGVRAGGERGAAFERAGGRVRAGQRRPGAPRDGAEPAAASCSSASARSSSSTSARWK